MFHPRLYAKSESYDWSISWSSSYNGDEFQSTWMCTFLNVTFLFTIPTMLKARSAPFWTGYGVVVVEDTSRVKAPASSSHYLNWTIPGSACTCCWTDWIKLWTIFLDERKFSMSRLNLVLNWAEATPKRARIAVLNFILINYIYK